MPNEALLKTLYDRESWFEGGQRGGQGYDSQTDSAPTFLKEILADAPLAGTGSVLDIGCGYGTHLALAAQHGWKCFGIEPSEHARRIAEERHGNNQYVVDHVDNLIPHRFDIILLLDVVEHLKNPYGLFFSLFSKGAITPDTKIVVTTPNARSVDAVTDPAGWAFRHPPSHLVYYSAESLRQLLTRLHFTHITLAGLHPIAGPASAAYADEAVPSNSELAAYAGLLCTASGSDFTEFMHERYVPGTWSKIAEYEHLPRYVLAKTLAAGARVLDFGCGTGYGSALLAEVAQTAVGVDIDHAALEWANQIHRNPRLRFEQRSDLGAGLPDHSFDLITCFEMIEHVGEATQVEVVRNMARLLVPSGKFAISTPNPEVTAQYGDNPYHIREMNEAEFEQLLRPHFRHIRILRQWVSPCAMIAEHRQPTGTPDFHEDALHSDAGPSTVPPLAFIAICSDQPLDALPSLLNFDFSFDYIAKAIATDKALNATHLENFSSFERAAGLERSLVALGQAFAQQEHNLQELRANLAEQQKSLARKTLEVEAKNQELEVKSKELAARNTEINAIKQSRWYRLGNTLSNEKLSPRKIAKIVYLLGALIAPAGLKLRMSPLIVRMRRHFAPSSQPATTSHTYQSRQLYPSRQGRPRVLHAIANFMTGGSSRLVVDLIEHLGHLYEQEVITSFVPNPPAYEGLAIREYRHLQSPEELLPYLDSFRPDIIHVHYWGDCDAPWYDKVFLAAAKSGARIAENINTPVHPYESEAVDSYVYVSDYVRQAFGRTGAKNVTIYPGSNFGLFVRDNLDSVPDNCVGMVYRLESDKLNEESIDVFVKVAQRRPETKILIVGGGTFLELYKEAVRKAGVSESFVFTDYVPYEDLPGLYAQMSVFAAPVCKESFGQVSMFAQNMGIPVVGYNVGALPEIVHDPDLLAPAGDSSRLADIVVMLLNDRDKRLDIGRSAQERAQKSFPVESMVASYGELYTKLLKDAR